MHCRWGAHDYLHAGQQPRSRVYPPAAPALCLRLAREWAHLNTVEARMTVLAAARDAQIAAGADRVAVVARQICTMRGVAETRAAVVSAEDHRGA